MAATQVVPSLTRWGVSATADLVYRTLTTFGPSTVDRISGSLEVKARQVRVALDELVALDAVDTSTPGNGDDRVWKGRPASDVVGALRQLQAQTAASRHRLREQLTRLTNPGFIPDPGLLSRHTARPLHGTDQVRGRLAELVARERHEHLAMNPLPAFDAETIRAAAPLNRSLHARGISVMTLGVPATADDEAGWHRDELDAYGLAYRQLPHLPSKIMILDRRTAILPIDPGRLRSGAWEISAPAVVRQLVGFFLEHWERARDPGRDWTPPMTLTPRERAILALLAKGYTDAAVAAKLEISVRTIAYTVSSLMDRYHVSNRFQLGLVLGAGTSDLPPGRSPDPSPASDNEPERPETEHE